MITKPTVSLIGCGWLGFPLAIKLLAQDYKVRGSSTTQSKVDQLSELGIDSYLVQYLTGNPLPDINPLLDADVIIVTIPPGRTTQGGFDNYQLMVDHLSNELENLPRKKLILVSSTSVYEDQAEECNENSPTHPKTESGRLLQQTEIRLATLQHNLIILRLAGLIGPARHPARFFAGKKNIPGGRAPVNLIHLEDAIGILLQLIPQNFSGILNACAPSHPSRMEFYTRAAAVKQLELPHFIIAQSEKKIIRSLRLEELKYEFIYPDLMNWVENSGEE